MFTTDNIITKGNWDGFKNHPQIKSNIEYTASNTINSLSQNEKTRLAFATMGLDHIFPTDILMKIIHSLNWNERIRLGHVSKIFAKCIKSLYDPLFRNSEKFWEFLGVPKPPTKFDTTSAVLAVYLIGTQYTWKDIGFTKTDWNNAFKIGSARRQKQALSTFSLKGIDALINQCLKKHNIPYKIKGIICDDINETIIVNQPLECQLTGINLDLAEEDNDHAAYNYCENVYIMNSRGPVFSIVSNNSGVYPFAESMNLIFAISNPWYKEQSSDDSDIEYAD